MACEGISLISYLVRGNVDRNDNDGADGDGDGGDHDHDGDGDGGEENDDDQESWILGQAPDEEPGEDD